MDVNPLLPRSENTVQELGVMEGEASIQTANQGTGLRETIWIDGQYDDGLESHTWNNSNSL